MEFDVSYNFENEDQFWAELDEIVAKDCPSHTHIDNALRSYLNLTTAYREEYLRSEYEIATCSYKLHSSPLFDKYPDYVRRQIVQCLLEDDNVHTLHLAASFLLADGKEHEATFELMNKEGSFARLVDLISRPRQDGQGGLHRLLMALLYEMSRIQKIQTDDLAHVTDDFITHLFQIIEMASDDVNDPYHYPVIRVLLVLNEQFMVAAHDPAVVDSSATPLTNKVIKVISANGSDYKSFDETSLQLLTLKLLYLIFTTPPTYEYFYTNDLRVLVDILIRNLLDLPEDAAALRHTYLRVLYPLLAHTQLRHPPQYKREEIRKLLAVLARGQVVDDDGCATDTRWAYFEEVDDTTKRLVRRCQKVPWLTDADAGPIVPAESAVEDKSSATSPTSPASPTSPTKSIIPGRLLRRGSSKQSELSVGPFLTPNLEAARHSSVSMMEMATQREKPGVLTPSRNPSKKEGLRAAIMGRKERPPVPKARRSGWSRGKLSRSDDSAAEVARSSLQEPKERTPEPVAVTPEIKVDAPETELADSSKSEAKSPPKKPPPAPKSRRWRGRRGRPDDPGGNHTTQPRGDPGATSDGTLPSITTTTTEDNTLLSPFSPEEKTLSPQAPSTAEKESITTALHQAQAQAITGISETLALERLHLHADDKALSPIPEVMRRPHQVVLAPPSLAPDRGVPGPQWELERSPFLTDEEVEEDEGDGTIVEARKESSSGD